MQEPLPPPIEFIAAFMEAAAAACPMTEAELKPELCGETEDIPMLPTIEFIVYAGAIGLRLPFELLLLLLLFGIGPGPPLLRDPTTSPGVLLPLVLFVANEFAETSEYSFCISNSRSIGSLNTLRHTQRKSPVGW